MWDEPKHILRVSLSPRCPPLTMLWPNILGGWDGKVGAEMLTNGRGGYQMTPGEREGEQSRESPSVTWRFSYWLFHLLHHYSPHSASLHLFIWVWGSLSGLSKVHLAVVNQFILIHTNPHATLIVKQNTQKNTLLKLKKTNTWQTAVCQCGPSPTGSD